MTQTVNPTRYKATCPNCGNNTFTAQLTVPMTVELSFWGLQSGAKVMHADIRDLEGACGKLREAALREPQLQCRCLDCGYQLALQELCPHEFEITPIQEKVVIQEFDY